LPFNEVFVVYKGSFSAFSSLIVYAICSDRPKSKIARSKVSNYRRHGRFYDENPAFSPYAAEIHILKIPVDTLYSLGILSQVKQGRQVIL
jgi:hypothetical protein